MVFKKLLLGLFASTAFAAPSIDRTETSQYKKRGLRSFVINPECEKNDTDGITDSSSIMSRNTSSGLGDFGTDCALDASSSGQKVVHTLRAYPNGLEGKAGEVIITYTGDASLYKVNVVQNSAVIASQQLKSVASTQAISFIFGTDNSQAITVEIEATSASAAAIKYIIPHVGEATNVGTVAQSQVLLQGRRITSAQAIGTNSQTVIVFNSAGLDPYAGLNTSTGVYTVPFTTRVTVRVSANQSSVQTSNSAQTLRVRKNSSTQTGCEHNMVFVAANSSLHVAACAFDVVAGDTIDVTTASDSDTSYSVDTQSAIVIESFPTTSQTVVRQDAPGVQWTAFTPTGTWVSNTTYTGFYQCSQGTLRVSGKVAVTGTPTSATLNVNIPSGFTIDTTKLSSTVVGGQTTALPASVCTIGDSGTGAVGCYTGYQSTTAVKFVSWLANSTYTIAGASTDVTQAVPITWANGDGLDYYYEVPVTAGSPCSNGQQLLIPGSVYSSSTGVERIERAIITGGSNNVVCSSSPCAIQSQSGSWLSGVTRSATGTYSASIASGTFSAAPTCVCSATRPGTGPTDCSLGENPSTSGFSILTHADGTGQDGWITLHCMGLR